MIVATSTNMVLLQSSRQVGQVVFWVSSMYDSFKYSLTLAILCSSRLAREQGFEP